MDMVHIPNGHVLINVGVKATLNKEAYTFSIQFINNNNNNNI